MKKLMLIGFLVSSFAFGQKASMSLDDTRIRIGQQTVLRIFFEYSNPKEDALIGWPQFDENLTDKVEIIEKTVDYESLVDSATQTYLREQQLTISAFEPDTFEIPAMQIEFNESVYETNPVQLIVETVEVDTSKGIVDIKPIYSVEYSFGEMAKDWLKTYWYVFAIAGAAIAIFFLIRLVKKYRKEKPEPEAPKIPAHVTALAVLQDLMLQERWRTENKKEYYSTLTDTVRRYLEERFDIYALEKTTREILTDLKNADISDSDKLYLKKILNQADMVKFAKFNPADEDGLVSLTQSIEFVERTKKHEITEEKNQPKASE
jgi:hypothetical protein